MFVGLYCIRASYNNNVAYAGSILYFVFVFYFVTVCACHIEIKGYLLKPWFHSK